MTRVDLTPEEAAFLRDRIEHFEREAPENLRWQIPYVREHRALPLYLGWTETIGICCDGTLTSWSTEEEWTGSRELDDPMWVKVALVTGSKRYPELRRLIPARPDGARTCEECAGTGRLQGLPAGLDALLCGECGGVGWRE